MWKSIQWSNDILETWGLNYVRPAPDKMDHSSRANEVKDGLILLKCVLEFEVYKKQ